MLAKKRCLELVRHWQPVQQGACEGWHGAGIVLHCMRKRTGLEWAASTGRRPLRSTWVPRPKAREARSTARPAASQVENLPSRSRS